MRALTAAWDKRRLLPVPKAGTRNRHAAARTVSAVTNLVQQAVDRWANEEAGSARAAEGENTQAYGVHRPEGGTWEAIRADGNMQTGRPGSCNH